MESNSQAQEGRSPATGSVLPEPLHVYEWLDQPAKDEPERLAKEWLEAFVKPAIEKDEEWLGRYLLLCDYHGETYLCSGASRMGDVWLRAVGSPNFYDLRVDVEELSNWQRKDHPSPAPPRKPFKAGALLAMAALIGGGFCLNRGGPSAASIRNDPKRPKTDADLERMEAAQRKRDRKAARKGPPNASILP